MNPSAIEPRSRRRLVAPIVMVAAVMSMMMSWASPAHAQGGMGVSPTTLEIRDAFRGQTYSVSLLLNNENDEPAEFELQPSGEIADWLKFGQRNDAGVVAAPATKFPVARKSRISIVVSVAVPASTPNKSYQASILVVGAIPDEDPTKKSGSTVGLAFSVPILVEVNGNEKRQGAVTDMFVDGAEAGQNQRFNANIKNTGNVSIIGQIDVKILRGETVVAELTNKGKNPAVAPGQDGVVTVEWPTADQSPGNYTAQFRVSDIGGSTAKELGGTTLPFRLEPRGTLTRAGNFQELKLLNEPEVGGVAKTAAYFINAGKIDTKAVFSGELYRNGKLIKSVTSLEKLVTIGNREVVEMNIDIPEGGDYRLVGKMNFEGVESPEKELTFTVGTSGGGGGSKTVPIAAAAGAIVLIGLAIFLLIKRRGSKTPPPTPRAQARERLGV